MEEESMFETGVIDHDVVVSSVEEPSYGSKEWHEYVMAQFEDGELIDGNPTCAGLRRVAEELLGDIVISGPCQVFPSTDGNGPGRATVVFEVVFENWRGSRETRVYKEVADVWHGNTDDLFCAHPVATASTRAEGRALRKALKIRCLAAEELTRKKDVEAVVKATVKVDAAVTSGLINEKDKVTVAQLNFLDNKCKQLDINALKFIELNGLTSVVNDIGKKAASDLLTLLNNYQNGAKECPSTIKGYEKNWRNAE